MSNCAVGASRAPIGMSNWECRARRLANARILLAKKLQRFVVEIPDAICFDFNDLRHPAAYRLLEPEGLAHCGILRATGRVTILAATSRVLRRPDLACRLFALRRLAQRKFKRVVVVGPKGLVNETARLRARRAAGLVVAPERTP